LKTKSSIRLSRTTSRKRSTLSRESSMKPLTTLKSKLEIVELTWIMKILTKSSADLTELVNLVNMIRKRKL
jgi:hypothetical protein